MSSPDWEHTRLDIHEGRDTHCRLELHRKTKMWELWYVPEYRTCWLRFSSERPWADTVRIANDFHRLICAREERRRMVRSVDQEISAYRVMIMRQPLATIQAMEPPEGYYREPGDLEPDVLDAELPPPAWRGSSASAAGDTTAVLSSDIPLSSPVDPKVEAGACSACGRAAQRRGTAWKHVGDVCGAHPSQRDAATFLADPF